MELGILFNFPGILAPSVGVWRVKLVSWNVNGIRAAWEQGLAEFLTREQPDVIGFQEIKSQVGTLPESISAPPNYQALWHSGGRPGYSGVGLYLHERHKLEELWWVKGIGDPEVDREGRVLTLELPEFFFVTAYFPNSGAGGRRLPFKLKFCQAMELFCTNLLGRGKEVLLCGDLNIAPQELDVHDTTDAKGSSGFLPAEREWLEGFLQRGWVDVFRAAHPQEGGHYTWWSFFDEDRSHNRGWRIDSFLASEGLAKRVEVRHHCEVLGSDHCPIEARVL